MNWTRRAWVVIYLTMPPLLRPYIKTHRNELWWARTIVPHYRVYLLSDLRNSPPLKRSQVFLWTCPQTGLCRSQGKISVPPRTALLGMRELKDNFFTLRRLLYPHLEFSIHPTIQGRFLVK
ncbi:hypothetical protein AVEN_254209-1 [Araneus ventricosus]|uniref:Uncharacterized protein n=1 Tax=Araneus ventricosus TaxID=182803 RepID=A0A4Y2W873_ARAVE|nr:hypothetical protein AVEN_251129-1 [Araneus ventricosus]GBO33101.1 hypothetical protein AVEN_254209-1 [Araneus ventricosus]